jgi:hypothetical protein
VYYPVYNYRQISSLWFHWVVVYSIQDSAELVIHKLIEGCQRVITVNSQRALAGEEREEGLGINPAMKRHLELEIQRHCKMLQQMKVS